MNVCIFYYWTFFLYLLNVEIYFSSFFPTTVKIPLYCFQVPIVVLRHQLPLLLLLPWRKCIFLVSGWFYKNFFLCFFFFFPTVLWWSAHDDFLSILLGVSSDSWICDIGSFIFLKIFWLFYLKILLLLHFLSSFLVHVCVSVRDDFITLKL